MQLSIRCDFQLSSISESRPQADNIESKTWMVGINPSNSTGKTPLLCPEESRGLQGRDNSGDTSH